MAGLDLPIGTSTGSTETLSSWAAPYVTNMLGKGQALSNMPFQGYGGPLTAGQSPLQTQAFQGLANLAIPTNQQMTYNPQSFTGMAPTAPIAQQPMATGAQDYSVRRILTPEEKLLQSQLREAAGPGPTPADLFKALGMAPPTAQQGQMPSSIFEGLGGTVSGENQFTDLGSFAGKEGVLGPDDRPIGETQPVTQADIERFRATSQPGGLGGVSMPAGTTQQQPMQQQPMQQSPIEQYMSPYLQGALDPQYAAAQRQADISAQNLQSQFGKAGAYGGSRQGVAEAELQRGLLDRMAGITGTGYQQAFEQAQRQFNTEQDRQMQAARQAQTYGLEALGAQRTGGAEQRGIESEGVAADYAQFKEERDYPFKQVDFQKGLLSGLPIEQVTTQYADPSTLQKFGAGASEILTILDLLGFTKKEG